MDKGMLDAFNPSITADEARKIAEKQARFGLGIYMLDRNSSPLDSQRMLEAEHCWMFFRDPEIKMPPHARLRSEMAYCVSKRGSFSSVPDFNDDPVRLMEYLQLLSDYFGRREE